jgi:adenine/guanine phosphoribosyltransferase-like PRPP-binding protein
MIYDSLDIGLELDDLRDVVNAVIAGLQPHLAGFDSIAVRGVSGIVVGAPVALALGKPLVVVRKPTDNAHSRRHVNVAQAGARYVFLDDFVSTGTTRDAVTAGIADAGGPSGPYATYEYMHNRWTVHY